ncbi:MAG: extracellular solute-binding protein [Armatimonadota bacterium]|nr:extracellular solute-binding protein [Armatimonadota bacterium]MDR7457853.1 extracellular solute-binding protein [Armatimonadota bacterium]MDR7495821.1 extracellular solute-binding protein [Armatimonadota bacterium]MDR7511478.1 extracellular solute-binding protein [Armatimonadota bacterium]
MMPRQRLWGVAVLIAVTLAVMPAVRLGAQPAIEDRLVIITPVARTVADPAVAAFRTFAQRQFGVSVNATVVSAGTPVAYGRIREWGGRPEADVFWGGEPALFDDLAERRLLAPLELPEAVMREIPASIGTPKPIALKDPRNFWVGCCLTPYGVTWHPRLLRRLGMEAIRDWDDLLDCRLKGQISQATPDRSSSNHASYEVILQRLGWQRGWEWAQRLGANTGIFVARSRDVPTVVAKGEFAAGFAVPAYMAFEDLLDGHDLKYVTPTAGFVTPEPLAVIANARNARTARAFIQFILSEEGQRTIMARGQYAITPKYRMEGPRGSALERMAEFAGARSFFDRPLQNIYDDAVAQQRYSLVNDTFRKLVLERHNELKRLHCQ